jgi:hypothetical protein
MTSDNRDLEGLAYEAELQEKSDASGFKDMLYLADAIAICRKWADQAYDAGRYANQYDIMDAARELAERDGMTERPVETVLTELLQMLHPPIDL